MFLSFLSKLKQASRLLIYISTASIVANVFLVYQWQSERTLSNNLLKERENQLATVTTNNQRLSRENYDYKIDIAQKDQDIQQKEEELTVLLTELEAKKKEVESKVAELATLQSDLSNAQKRIDDQKSQLEVNASELSKLRARPPLFSFQVKSTTLADIETKKAAVKQVVTDAYEKLEEIYGKAYLLHQVTITFVDQFTNSKAAGEIVISNTANGLDIDIRIKDFDRNNFANVNTVIHEVAHAFHGLAVLEPTPFEEGIAVAVTDLVMERMITDKQLPSFSPLYVRLNSEEFEAKQASLSIPRDSNKFYTSEQVADYYQVLGYAWLDLERRKSGFLKQFNEKIYAKKNSGQEITESIVLAIIKEVMPEANLTGAAWQLR